MTIEEQLANKRPVIERTARTFIRRVGWIEFDDAFQIVSLAAWRILTEERRSRDVDAAIAWYGYRRLTDELRTGHVTGITRTGFRDGEKAALSLNRHGAVPLDYIDRLADENDPYAQIDRDQTPSLGAAMERLPQRERFVVYLHHFEGLTLRETGELLGVSESRISQLITKAHSRMRPLLTA